MFKRKEYKAAAKSVLTGEWTYPVLITVFTLAVSLTVGGSSQAIQKSAPFAGAVIRLLSIVICATMTFAMLKFLLLMKNSQEPLGFRDYINQYNCAPKAAGAVLYQGIFVYLWTVLFFLVFSIIFISTFVHAALSDPDILEGIDMEEADELIDAIISILLEKPGHVIAMVFSFILGTVLTTIKLYQYSLMFPLLVLYPNLPVTYSLNLSKKLTKGQKWNLFVLDLSFIGWYFLAIVTLGVGLLWLLPYHKLTKLNACQAIVKDAVEAGTIKEEDIV